MLKTLFVLGLLALAGLLALKLVFGIIGGLVGVFFALLGIAIPVLLLGALLYVVLRVFAPERADALRTRVNGL
ncbi:MAG: hypothetical protein RL139_9 [Gemmatimonadota bacterium]|jgi:hypothetical protein